MYSIQVGTRMLLLVSRCIFKNDGAKLLHCTAIKATFITLLMLFVGIKNKKQDKPAF